MTDPNTDPEELDPADLAVGEQLRELRAVPRGAFAGALGRHLASIDPGYGPRPANLRLMATGWVIAGLALLLAGALAAGGII